MRDQVLITVEEGVNHNGNIDTAKKLIDSPPDVDNFQELLIRPLI